MAARTAELAQSELLLRHALHESETQRKQLELVLDASHAAVGEWNVAEGTLRLSDSWYRMLGYEPQEVELSAKPWQDYVHPEDWPEVVRLAEHSGEAGNQVVELTFRVRHKDGSWRWNRHRGVVTAWGPDGRPSQILGIELDITEQRELEQQLLHSAKMQSLGAFAGGIAHDFNNVLAIIQGHAEALERPTAGHTLAEDQLERIDAIQRAVARAASLVRNLMLLNRPTVGGQPSVDLAAFLNRSNATLPYLLGEDVRLEITVPPHPVLVAIDEGRFEAVVLNLAANARDAMPLGGTFAITLSTDDGLTPSALLRVTDTGVGMSEATVALVFDPYFTTKAPGAGTGLGMATTYATISDALGTISIDSQPNEGTTVSIVLPLTTLAEPSHLPDPGAGEVAPFDATILLVEDEAELLELTTDVLRGHGFRVHDALDAREALEILDGDAGIDLVITDAVMPGMSGPELASIIRRRWPSIKILLMSGYAAGSPMNDRFTNDQLLTKPVAAEHLTSAVIRALRSD